MKWAVTTHKNNRQYYLCRLNPSNGACYWSPKINVALRFAKYIQARKYVEPFMGCKKFADDWDIVGVYGGQGNIVP